MSSLSSIENGNELSYYSYRINEAYPWYPALGPLIYYSKAQPKQHKRSKEKKKNTSNIFVKAFKWYTEEHGPNSKADKVDIKDFASWLDEKYNDFLQNSHTKDIYNETSTMDIVASSNKIEKTEKKSKKQSRLRSIAQFRNQINSGTQSDTSIVEKKLIPKSQSLTSILKEREIYVIPFDIVQDGKDDVESEKKSEFVISKRDSTLKYKKNNIKDITCECSYIMSNRADVTRKLEKKTSRSNICLCNDVEPTALRKKQNILRTLQVTQGKVEKNSTMKNKNLLHSTFVNDSVQTSDHSINLEENIGCPIFMQLISPDKMTQRCFFRTQT